MTTTAKFHQEPCRDPLPIKASPNLDIDLKSISSAALARLVDEVRNDEAATNRAYDRVHNRHNR
jgi:hypothetical protein